MADWAEPKIGQFSKQKIDRKIMFNTGPKNRFFDFFGVFLGFWLISRATQSWNVNDPLKKGVNGEPATKNRDRQLVTKANHECDPSRVEN